MAHFPPQDQASPGSQGQQDYHRDQQKHSQGQQPFPSPGSQNQQKRPFSRGHWIFVIVVLLLTFIGIYLVTHSFFTSTSLGLFFGAMAMLLSTDIIKKPLEHFVRQLIVSAEKRVEVVFSFLQKLADSAGKSPGGVRSQRVTSRGFVVALGALVLLLGAGDILQLQKIPIRIPIPVLDPTPTPTLTPTLPAAARDCFTAENQGARHGLGVKLQGRDCVGLSDGNALLDINDHDQTYVSDAIAAVTASQVDPLSAQTQAAWYQAIQDDQSNAEPRIYFEDIQVQNNDHPHATIIVAAILTGIYYHDGRDVLQGVYLEQKEHNDACRKQNYQGCILLNVIIANIGSGIKDESDYAKQVADQMTVAIRNDSTIVGVMSGINSQGTINMRDELNKTLPHPPPIVAAKATYDQLSGSSHLFRVVAPDSIQAQTAADYAKKILKVSRIAVLYRKGDVYSVNLEGDFSGDFPSLDGKYQTAGAAVGYTPRDASSVVDALRTALRSRPEALYCACYANEANTILQWLGQHPQYNRLLILGGDALYELGDYTPDTRLQMYRLRFTAFTYPDLWNTLGSKATSVRPQGIDDYGATYGAHSGNGQYGRTRMTPGTSVAYDAMLVLGAGCNQVLTFQPQVTAPALERAIPQKGIVGISGRIMFGRGGPSSDPYDKIIVVIQVVNQVGENGQEQIFFQYTGFHEGTFV